MSPKEPAKTPKAPLRERAEKIAQELVDNLNRNVLADNPSSNVAPVQDKGSHFREQVLAELRKQYPNLSDEELIEATAGLL